MSSTGIQSSTPIGKKLFSLKKRSHNQTKFCFVMGAAILLCTRTKKIIIRDGIVLADENICPRVNTFSADKLKSAVIFYRKSNGINVNKYTLKAGQFYLILFRHYLLHQLS